MPKGQHLSKETIAEIVELYKQGWTYAAMGRQCKITDEAARKAVFRALGPAGTPERPRRPPPLKGTSILSQEQRELAVKLYEQNHNLQRTGETLGVSAKAVRNALVLCGVPINRTGPHQTYPDFACPVCQKRLPRNRVTYERGTVQPLRTCGDPNCEATMAFSGQDRPPVSRKGTRTDKGGWTAGGKAGYRKRQELEQRLLVQRLEVDRAALAKLLTVEQVGEYEERYELTQDARGVRQPIAQDTLWHGLSRVPVYLRLVARTEGHAAIRLLVPSGYTVLGYFIQKFFGGSVEYAAKINGAFNPLIAWRCSCPEQKTWTLAQLEHLPAEPGVYGVCATCGACALRIEIEK